MTTKRVLSSAVLLFLCTVLFCSCGDRIPSTVLSAEDVNGKNIGVVESSVSEDFTVKQFGDNNTVKLYASAGAAVNDLNLGLIDCIVTDVNDAKNVTRGQKGLRTISATVGKAPLAVMCARERGDLASILSSGLSSMEESGQLKSIIESNFNGKSADIAQGGEYSATLHIAVIITGAPYAWYDEGTLRGFEVDILRYICAQRGIGAEFSVMTRENAMSYLIAGKVDAAVGGLFEAENQSPLYTYSTPYYTSEQVIITRK